MGESFSEAPLKIQTMDRHVQIIKLNLEWLLIASQEYTVNLLGTFWLKLIFGNLLQFVIQ